jgi:hypothetical protein
MLRPYIAQVAVGSLADDKRLTLCVRASLAKAFEFCFFSHDKLRDDFAFHCVGGLRSICEDLIILKFISALPLQDQNILLEADLNNSIQKGSHYQEKFFRLYRPGQPVFSGSFPAESLRLLDAAADGVWRRHGWPNAKDGKRPPTEQIARKVGRGTIEVIYDYIFRLTSGTVHFNSQALLRTGWGDRTPDCLEVTFSTKYMSPYYSAFCKVYGVFLLSIYFEFFCDLLKIPTSAQSRMQRMRLALARQNRWPEMLTFEEFNKEMPENRTTMRFVMQHVLAEEFKTGFIKEGEELSRRLTEKGPKERNR